MSQATDLHNEIMAVIVKKLENKQAEYADVFGALDVRDAPEGGAAKKDSKHSKHLQILRGAWKDSGAEERGGKPYISRSGFRAYLVKNLELKEASADVYLKPSAHGKPVADLLLGGVISSYELGWVVEDAVLGASWIVARRGK